MHTMHITGVIKCKLIPLTGEREKKMENCELCVCQN